MLSKELSYINFSLYKDDSINTFQSGQVLLSVSHQMLDRRSLGSGI